MTTVVFNLLYFLVVVVFMCTVCKQPRKSQWAYAKHYMLHIKSSNPLFLCAYDGCRQLFAKYKTFVRHAV